MNFRLWYPQLDVYDTIRRMAVLLRTWRGDAPGIERFYIVDFYLANPSLLHQTHMPATVRAAFRQLSVPQPANMFVSYPSPPLLFHKMEPVQKLAVRTMTGKGLFDRPSLLSGRLLPSRRGEGVISDHLSQVVDNREAALARFLVEKFALVDEDDIRGFRRRTGLRRLT